MAYGIGVDVGATYTRVALADESGEFLAKISEKTVREGDSLALTSQIISLVERAMEESGISIKRVSGIGIGSIGPLDLRTGTIIKPANLPYENVPLVEPLRRRFKVDVYLLNDATAAVVGERYFGSGKDCENLVYVTISTGIGGGVYVDGHLLIGKDGNAAEIGHIAIDPEGKLICGCGKRGHWEAYSSGSGVPNLARLIIGSKRREDLEGSLLLELAGGRPDRITSKMVYEAAKRGDRLALEVVNQASLYNALGIATIVNVYDPSLITIGGSVALNNPELVLDPIKRLAPEYVINRFPDVILTPLGGDVVLYGALALSLGFQTVRLPG